MIALVKFNYKKKFIYERTMLMISTIMQFAGHFLIAYFTKNIVLIAIYSIFIFYR